jgi:hypothetical protein
MGGGFGKAAAGDTGTWHPDGDKSGFANSTESKGGLDYKQPMGGSFPPGGARRYDAKAGGGGFDGGDGGDADDDDDFYRHGDDEHGHGGVKAAEPARYNPADDRPITSSGAYNLEGVVGGEDAKEGGGCGDDDSGGEYSDDFEGYSDDFEDDDDDEEGFATVKEEAAAANQRDMDQVMLNIRQVVQLALFADSCALFYGLRCLPG